MIVVGELGGRVSPRLSIRGLLSDDGASMSLAIFSSFTSSASSKSWSRNSFSSDGGVGCCETRLPGSIGGLSGDNVGYSDGPCFSSHLRCRARLFFVMGVCVAHGLHLLTFFVVWVSDPNCRCSAPSEAYRRVLHVSGQVQLIRSDLRGWPRAHH